MNDAARRAIIGQTAETLLRLAKQGAASGAQVLLTTIIPVGRPEILRLPVWTIPCGMQWRR